MHKTVACFCSSTSDSVSQPLVSMASHEFIEPAEQWVDYWLFHTVAKRECLQMQEFTEAVCSTSLSTSEICSHSAHISCIILPLPVSKTAFNSAYHTISVLPYWLSGCSNQESLKHKIYWFTCKDIALLSTLNPHKPLAKMKCKLICNAKQMWHHLIQSSSE